MLCIGVIDNDEIEIGGSGHFAAAELTERQQCDLLLAQTAMLSCKNLLNLSIKRADHRAGEPRKRLPGLFRRYRARKHARSDQEHLLLTEHADLIEKFLVSARLAEIARKLNRQLFLVGQRAEESRIEQRINGLRVACEDVGKARRDAEDTHDQRDQIGILL